MTRAGGSTVLLVGDRKWNSSLRRHLEGRGYDCTLTATLKEAQRSLRTHRFAIVLSRISLADGSGSALIGSLAGTRASMYLCMTVRKGWLWVPAVKEGIDCWGAPALGPGQSLHILDGILEETVEQADKRGSANRHRFGWLLRGLQSLVRVGLLRPSAALRRHATALIWPNRSITHEDRQIKSDLAEAAPIRSIDVPRFSPQAQGRTDGPPPGGAIGMASRVG